MSYMPTPNALPPHRRTVEEAVAQADAKERIRNAQGLRGAGLAGLVFGLGLLARRSTWRPYSQAVGVHLHGGPSFTLSFTAIIGILAVAVGPVLIAVGQWLLGRAERAAADNPVTAPILGQVDV